MKKQKPENIIHQLSRNFACIILASSLFPTPLAQAQDPNATPTIRATQYGGPERWENGLSVKSSGLYDVKPGVGGKAPVILTAEWNRKYETYTYLGLTFSTMAQPINGPFSDFKSKIMTYYGGINLAQGLLELNPFRVVLGVSAGLGSMFIRAQIDGDSSRMNRADYRFYEPSLFFTFFEYAGLEFGVTGSMRYVRLIKDFTMNDRILGTNKDFSSPTFGLAFRTQRR